MPTIEAPAGAGESGVEPKVAPPPMETWPAARAAAPPSEDRDADARTRIGSVGSVKKSETFWPASPPPAPCQPHDSSSEKASPVTGESAYKRSAGGAPTV